MTEDHGGQTVKGWPARVATEFDGLSVLRGIGEGSIATVFLAWESAQKRFVALKVLKADYSNDADARARFRNEALVGATLVHPNVVGFYRSGERADGLPYLACEYIGGEPLSNLLASAEVSSADELIRITADLARALAAAHAKGIVHGRMEPSNILIERDTGRAVLTNFGIAEQRKTSPADDILSLGLIGNRLLGGDGPEEVLRILVSCMDANPTARPTADEVVLRLPNVGRTFVLHDPRQAERANNSSLMRIAAVSGLIIMALGAAVAVWLFIHYSG